VSSRPIVGVATQTLEAVPGKLPPCWVMGQRYVRTLTAAGALPWLIPLLPGDEDTLRAIYEQLDGIFLTGGVDIDPTNYGEERQPLCDRIDPARDWTELALVRWAIRDHKPVLGVCRGIQAINVACGGTLYQDIGHQHPQAIKHDYFPTLTGPARDFLAHPVRLTPRSRIHRVLGAEQVQVNSMHHQGIKRLAPGLTATAFAPDGLIEAIEKPGSPYLVGVQWHPEELADAHDPMRRLFADFVEAVSHRSAAHRGEQAAPLAS
jgi:putative glutamine amidotransferase